MDMSERIRKWRDGRGWSLAEAAVHIGCSPSSLRNYEAGAAPKNRALRLRIKRVLAAWERATADALSDGKGGEWWET